MKSLQSAVRGEVLEPAPAAYHRDFGGVRTVVPRSVFRPKDGALFHAALRSVRSADAGAQLVSAGARVSWNRDNVLPQDSPRIFHLPI